MDLTQLDVLIRTRCHRNRLVLVAALIVSGSCTGRMPNEERSTRCRLARFLVYPLVACLFVAATQHHHSRSSLFVAASAATVAIAWRTDAQSAPPATAALTVLAMVSFALERETLHLVAPGGPAAGLPPEPSQVNVTLHMILGAVFVALFGGTGFLAQGRSAYPRIAVLRAAAGVATPIAIVAALYFRIAGFERSIRSRASCCCSPRCSPSPSRTSPNTHRPQPGGASAQAIYATGAIAALALAFTMALDRGWLTIALALMVPGIAYARARAAPARTALACRRPRSRRDCAYRI